MNTRERRIREYAEAMVPLYRDPETPEILAALPVVAKLPPQVRDLACDAYRSGFASGVKTVNTALVPFLADDLSRVMKKEAGRFSNLVSMVEAMGMPSEAPFGECLYCYAKPEAKIDDHDEDCDWANVHRAVAELKANP